MIEKALADCRRRRRRRLVVILFVVSIILFCLRRTNKWASILLTSMADDLANDWGTSITLLPGEASSRHAGRCRVNIREQSDCRLLRDEVYSTFGGNFQLEKVSQSGSDAQLHAIFQATGGDVNSCMVAAGSYVSGSNGGLQNWSTSDFKDMLGPSIILPPQDVRIKFAKTHTVGLPYHIPGTIETEELEAYEDRCLFELHVRCLAARINRAPFKALLMELLLAGNGSTLSDRALTRIGMLAEHHGFCIVLDEIMTAGRTGTMLMLLQKPEPFRMAVRYVTMGKWMGAGLVLACREETERLLYIMNEVSCRNHADRILSNALDCTGIVAAWREVRKKLGNAQRRREAALKRLRLPESHCWGEGTIIFAPIRRSDICLGLKCRFLPLLDDVPFGTFNRTKKDEWSKGKVNEAIVTGVNAWIDYGPTAINEVLGSSLDDDNLTKAVCLLLRFFSSSGCFKPHQTFRKVDITRIVPGPHGIPPLAWKKVGALCARNGILTLKRLHSERVETYIITPLLIPPWQHRE